MALNPLPWHQKYRPANLDPLQHDGARPPPAAPGMLSVMHINIFSKHKKLTLGMSNCENIEVVLLYPADVSGLDLSKHDSSTNPDFLASLASSQERKENEEENQESQTKIEFSMSATTDDHDISHASRDSAPFFTPTQPQQSGIFRFLDLPLELRLKIYTLLLPPRTHKITTQIPHNGFFYNTSTIPLHSATSFYPFGTSAPKKPQNETLTTYKVLNRNFRTDFPEPSIYPHLLLVCRQIKEEAEPILYSDNGVEWDFGTCIEALKPFFGDRSVVARECIRHVKVAREIRDNGREMVDYGWERFCGYVCAELPSLRTVDLTIWSSSGSVTGFPGEGGGDGAGNALKKQDGRWRELEFVGKLLEVESLRKARVTWWGFQGGEKGGEERGQGFDSWLARRMVGDQVVRERMIREGVVREGVVILSGS